MNPSLKPLYVSAPPQDRKYTLLLPQDTTQYPLPLVIGFPGIHFLTSQSPTGPHLCNKPNNELFYQNVWNPATEIEEYLLNKLFVALRPSLLHLIRSPKKELPVAPSPSITQTEKEVQQYKKEAQEHEDELRQRRKSLFSYLRGLFTQDAIRNGKEVPVFTEEDEEEFPLIPDLDTFDSTRPRTPCVARAYAEALNFAREYPPRRRRSLRLTQKRTSNPSYPPRLRPRRHR